MQKKFFEKLKEQNKKSNDTKTENKEEEYEIHEILLPGLSKGYGSQKEALKHILKTPNNSKQQGVQRVIFHVKNVNSLKLTSKDYFVYRLKGDVLCHKILKVDEKTQQIILKPVLKSDEKEPEEYTDSDEDWYKE